MGHEKKNVTKPFFGSEKTERKKLKKLFILVQERKRTLFFKNFFFMSTEKKINKLFFVGPKKENFYFLRNFFFVQKNVTEKKLTRLSFGRQN